MTREELLEELLVERFGPKPRHWWPAHEAIDRFEATSRVAALLEVADEESEGQ